MKTISFLYILLIVSACSYMPYDVVKLGRKNPCEKFNKYNVLIDGRFIDRDTCLIDYLITKKEIPKHHISIRDRLKEISAPYRTRDFVVFKDKNINMVIYIGEDSITNPNLKLHKFEYDGHCELIDIMENRTPIPFEDRPVTDACVEVDSINGIAPIGLKSRIHFNFIKKIKLEIHGKTINIDDTYHRDLFFPNFLEQYNSLQPVKMYYSEDKSSLYLYVFGNDIEQVIYGGNERSRSTHYMAKLIISLNDYTVNRYILNRGELLYYGVDCPTFNGF